MNRKKKEKHRSTQHARARAHTTVADAPALSILSSPPGLSIDALYLYALLPFHSTLLSFFFVSVLGGERSRKIRIGNIN